MIKVVIIAIVGALISALLKRINSNLSFVAAIATGVIIIVHLYVDIDGLLSVVNTFSTGYGISDGHIKLLLKVLGISYLTQFGTAIAEDCGEKFIAQKIEFAGRIFILSLSVPIMINLLNNILGLM